jgi:hypothetical protein
MAYAFQQRTGDPTRLRPKPDYLFAVRTPSHVLHHRLRDAAAEDNLTIAQELSKLLDLRAQWDELTAGAHPLGRPAPVPVLIPLEPVTVPPKLTIVETPPKTPQWRTKGTYNRGREGQSWFLGPASAHDSWTARKFAAQRETVDA